MISQKTEKKKKADVWTSLKNTALDLLFGKECFFCGCEKTFLCPDCVALLDVSQNHRQHRNGCLADLYSACSYDNRFVKKLVRSFKYEPFLKELAGPLASLLYDHLQLLENRPDFSKHIVVSVPIADRRRRWRSFNQAETLAREFAKLSGLSFFSCLKKIRDTPAQTGLDANERRANVKKTVACFAPEAVFGKEIILIDDVFTTGATMEECARVLKRCGAKTVTGMAVAHAQAGNDN